MQLNYYSSSSSVNASLRFLALIQSPFVFRSSARGVLLAALLLSVLIPYNELAAQQAVEDSISTDGAAAGQNQGASSTEGQLPDAPGQSSANPSERAPQTKRILGIIPNFRAISTDEKLPPQSVKDKFTTTMEDSFDYSSIFIPAMLAAYSMDTKASPEFGQGAVGYGRYFWHSAVDKTS